MIELKKANYRRNGDGQRVVEATLYTKSLENLPTSAADIDGLLPDDVIDSGSIALDMTIGKVAMFDGTSWNIWA
ncbi:MAG: hypothetical protein J6D36_00250 [Erysipelotrichaceae bacterium]|nr:hypothetical protein [Erysipelotrichaceae bacterium]